MSCQSNRKVLLIDIDSRIPNLALMKISAYHKAQGDEVGFSVTDPDKVYASVIFKKNRHLVDGLRFYYPDAEIDVGGSGYDLKKILPDEIEAMTPDYSIYPDNTTYYGYEDAVSEAVSDAQNKGINNIYKTIEKEYTITTTDEWDAITMGTILTAPKK